VTAGEDYLSVIRAPEFGYGRGANPCVDCRIFMFRIARKRMDETGADLVASGEVLGQRPNSQGRRDLERIEIRSELEGRLLRPLSAKHLCPTNSENDGFIRRDLLYGFTGRSRKGLIDLAKSFGFDAAHIPTPSTGCMLTEKTFAPRVYDLLKHQDQDRSWDYELLKVGRHIRTHPHVKVIIGRNAEENTILEYMARREDREPSALMLPSGFSGPAVLVVGSFTEADVKLAGGLLLRFSATAQSAADIILERDGARQMICAEACAEARAAVTL